MQCFPVLQSLCKRFFNDDHEILTAINNGMLRVYKNIAQYDASRAELVTWIYTIVRNEALTVIRNKRREHMTAELTDELSAEAVSNPFEKTNAEQSIHYLGKLPETTRAVCSLFYFEEYSVKEIVAALQMKEGTVKWHLSEGRKKLHALFSNKKLLIL